MTNAIKQWILDTYEMSEIKDITEHGLVSGFHSLTYYSETVAFYDKFESEIWDAVNEMADEMGVSSLEFVASLNGAKGSLTSDTFKNLLTWFAVEHVCNELINEVAA